MKVNRAGIDLIKHFESCKLKAYPDPASLLALEMIKPENARRENWKKLPGNPWTIGYGATGINNFLSPPAPIDSDTEWTQEQAEERLSKDVNLFAKEVEALIKVDLTDNQFAALVSFAYNCGTSNLKSSTLLQCVNRGKNKDAADEFLRWNKAKGKVMNGLTRRREAERRLYLTP